MILQLLWILWLPCFCPGTNAQQFKHIITISTKGNDTDECLVNRSIPCHHLDYVLNAVINQNSTALFIEPGYYHLRSSFAFWHVKQFAIIGLSTNLQDVLVNCSSLAGLSFIYSDNIIMRNITFSSCGSLQNSTSRGHPKFLAGLFLVNCIGLEMNGVSIIDGPGIGMQLYDLAGTVTISNCHFLRNGNNSVTNVTNGFVSSGGGIYLEYTLKGGLWPFNASLKHIHQENSTFYFCNVTFQRNIAPKPYVNDSVDQPITHDHVAFGRGGGVSIFLMGRARNNRFWFENCYFNQSNAIWGAGVFAEFQQDTQNNSINFRNSHFYKNTAKYGGGGLRIGLITMSQSQHDIPNAVVFRSCHFRKNKAILGGAVSLYGTTKHSYDQSYVNFSLCVFEENAATVGSAFGCALWNTNDYEVQGGRPPKVFLMNCRITKNIIIFTEDEKVSGVGTLFSQGIPILLNNTEFTFNNGSALVLDNTIVQINGYVLFKKNIGRNGGAIGIYGRSKLKIAKKAYLKFDRNRCTVNGGAIYVRTMGPLLVAFKTTELNLHDCFISSTDEGAGFDPDKWDFNVSFFDNKSPHYSSGHSVFATTLQFCRKAGEPRINNKALQWKVFHYFTVNNSKSDMLYEVVTNPVEMKVNETEWNVTVDKRFSPALTLFDEKNNSVYGIINISLQANQLMTLDPPSTYYLAKDRIQSLRIRGKAHTRYNVELSTVDSQLVFQNINNVFLEECIPGFVANNNTCKCDLSATGVSRCDDENQIVFLLKGYWGGYVESSGKRKFVTVSCPENYCFCNRTLHSNHAASDGECFLDISMQCLGNRQGRLCGECKGHFSLEVGEDHCVDDCKIGLGWIGNLCGILLFLTFLVLVIMFINFDPFSAYLNAWLYSYQVILVLLPEGISLDPFLSFVVGLANVRIIGFGGVCMWSSIDDLQKLAFNYLLPMYVFICLFVLNKVALTCRNNCFTRRLTQTSTAGAFCTLFVLSYCTVVYVSLNILYPIKIGDKYFVFYQGTEKYFGSYHIGFAIIAILLLIFVGVLFPLVLIQRQRFSFIDKNLMRLLLDNFQHCFRDGFKWCAGFYFICRFVILLIATAAPTDLKVPLLQSVCSVILTVFILCKPYAESDGLISYHLLNTSDAVLLCNLCVLANFSGSLSGLFPTNLYYSGFKIFVEILSYVPLLYFFGLLGYFLINKYVSRHRLVLHNVGE